MPACMHLAQPPWLTTVAGDVLVFAVGITYAVVFPLIVPFLLIYFGVGYLAVRYMLCKHLSFAPCVC